MPLCGHFTPGRVSFGTEAGIRVFRPNGTSEDFNVRNSPVAGDQIYAIRVDPRTGVVWIGTSTGMNRYDPGYVPPPPPQLARLDLRIYPNPIALNRTGIQLRLNGNATLYRGRILDITGREIATFDVPANGRVIWDGRDREGRAQPHRDDRTAATFPAPGRTCDDARNQTCAASAGPAPRAVERRPSCRAGAARTCRAASARSRHPWTCR